MKLRRNSVKLDRTTIKGLTLEPGKDDQTFFDTTLPGFGLRLRASGVQMFVVQYDVGGKTRKITLGSPTTIDPGQARERARDILAAVRLGRDPAAEKQDARARLAETVGAILPRYLQSKRSAVRPKTYSETERYLLVHWKPLHGRAVTAVTRRDVALRLSEIAASSGAAAANKARAALGAFYSWLMREGIAESNPVAGSNKAVEGGARKRVLSDEEIVAVWRATAAMTSDYGTIVRLLILTGARRDEIGGLQLSEIDLEQRLIRLPANRTKGNEEHEIVLSPPALALIESQLQRHRDEGRTSSALFGRQARGWQQYSQAKRELDRRLDQPVEAWRLHDLRRSMSTVLNDRLGIEPHVVEAILGHVSGNSVARVYNRAQYLNQRRQALDVWADHVIALVEGRTATVVALRRA